MTGVGICPIARGRCIAKLRISILANSQYGVTGADAPTVG